MIFVLRAVANHLGNKEEPVDVDLKHFWLAHRIDEKVEESQVNFFIVDSKYCFEPSFYGEFIDVWGENVILAVHWDIS